MITNKVIIDRIKAYVDVIQGSFIVNFSDKFLDMIQEDLDKLAQKSNKNLYTTIDFESMKHYRANYKITINAFMKIWFDYYFAYNKESVLDETIDEFINLIRNVFINVVTSNRFPLLALQPIYTPIKEYKNHESDYYINKYFDYLSNEMLFDKSEFVQEESYRQCCNLICKLLIKEKNSRKLIDFYKVNKRYVSSKTLIEFLIDSKINIDNDFYDYQFLSFLSSLCLEIDTTLAEKAKSFIKDNEKANYIVESLLDDVKKGYGSLYDGVHLYYLLTSFFNFIAKNKALLNGFDKYTDKVYEQKLDSKVRMYKCSMLIYYINEIDKAFNSTKSEDEIDELIDRLVFSNIKTIAIINNDVSLQWEHVFPTISTSCIDFIEHFIDYLINLKEYVPTRYFKDVKELDLCIFSSLNLYLQVKYHNSSIIRQDDHKFIDFKEAISLKLNSLQEKFVLKNVYLAERLDSSKKIEIIKDFFKSAFDDFVENGQNTNCLNIYSELNINNVKVEKIDLCVEAIKNNAVLVNQIVSGEILAQPFLSIMDHESFSDGDYTNFLTCQIKAIERYLKAILIKYHHNNIYKTQRNKETNAIEKVGRNIRGVSPQSSPEVLKMLECGSAYYALKIAYEEESTPFPINSNFNFKWIQKVRNGHFHVDRIQSINELRIKRCKTAYWFIHVIVSLNEKGVL